MNTTTQNLKRAILVFTRTPENEARHKPLSPRLSFNERVELYESFTRHVLQQAEATEYPLLIATDAPDYDFSRYSNNIASVLPQCGATFGEKLANAIAAAFAQGYEEVVCVGNDCLQLSAADLQTAFARLAQSSLVMGATRDGGVYLIGMRRSCTAQFLQALLQCHWQTGIVFRDLLEAGRRLCLTIDILAARSDIDVPLDLIVASRCLPGLVFIKKVIEKIFAHIFAFPIHNLQLHTNHIDRVRFQKAPPAVRL